MAVLRKECHREKICRVRYRKSSKKVAEREAKECDDPLVKEKLHKITEEIDELLDLIQSEENE